MVIKLSCDSHRVFSVSFPFIEWSLYIYISSFWSSPNTLQLLDYIFRRQNGIINLCKSFSQLSKHVSITFTFDGVNVRWGHRFGRPKVNLMPTNIYEHKYIYIRRHASVTTFDFWTFFLCALPSSHSCLVQLWSYITREHVRPLTVIVSRNSW